MSCSYCESISDFIECTLIGFLFSNNFHFALHHDGFSLSDMIIVGGVEKWKSKFELWRVGVVFGMDLKLVNLFENLIHPESIVEYWLIDKSF